MHRKAWDSLIRYLALVGGISFVIFGFISSVVHAQSEPSEGRIIQLSPNGIGRAYALAFSPDGGILAVGTPEGVRLYDAEKLTQILFIPTQSWVRCVAFSPDGKFLAVGSYDPVVRVWRVADGELEREYKGHSGWVRGLAYSPDGMLLATASDDDTVRIWQAEGGLEETLIDGMQGVRAVAFSPDGKLLATGGYDNLIHLWQVNNWQPLGQLIGHTGWIRSLVFSPDGEYLVSGGFDATVRLWSVSEKNLLKTLTNHTSSVLGLAFSPDGSLLASASVDTTVRLWQIPDGEPYGLFTGHTDFVYGVAFSPDGKRLASASTDNTVRLWEVPAAASNSALEQVASPSNCILCHHPLSNQKPARVIEVSCPTCHENGALVMNWCVLFPRSGQDTTVNPVSSVYADKAGVPESGDRVDVVIARPGNGEHYYARGDTLSIATIRGQVITHDSSPDGLMVQLQAWSGDNLVAELTTHTQTNGSYKFDLNLTPDGQEPPELKASEGWRLGECLICHNREYLNLPALPLGEIRLVVTATLPDGDQASDARWVVVDRSQPAAMPVKVVLDGAPAGLAAELPVQAETRLYEWRGRNFAALTGEDGTAPLQVEALTQAETKYEITVPPVVLGGILYTSEEPAEVTFAPGATTTSAVTLRVKATIGSITGEITPQSLLPQTSLPVWAIHLPDGGAQIAQASGGMFVFENLAVGKYLLTTDQPALAEQAVHLEQQSLDLSQSPQAEIDLALLPSAGTSITGVVRQQNGAPLPFGWVILQTGGRGARTMPKTGAYTLFNAAETTEPLVASAPGFYSQSQVAEASKGDQPVDFNLKLRPETQQIPWGDGEILIPPESYATRDGARINLERGWVWGKGASETPVQLQAAGATIKLLRGSFALEATPGEPPWLYLFEGMAEITAGRDGNPTPLEAGQMIALTTDAPPVPVPYDPVVISALNSNDQAPIEPAWEPTLTSQIKNRLAQAGITMAQVITLMTYLFALAAVIAGPVLLLLWLKKHFTKVKISR